MHFHGKEGLFENNKNFIIDFAIQNHKIDGEDNFVNLNKDI